MSGWRCCRVFLLTSSVGSSRRAEKSISSAHSATRSRIKDLDHSAIGEDRLEEGIVHGDSAIRGGSNLAEIPGRPNGWMGRQRRRTACRRRWKCEGNSEAFDFRMLPGRVPRGTPGWPEDGLCDVLGQLLYTVGHVGRRLPSQPYEPCRNPYRSSPSTAAGSSTSSASRTIRLTPLASKHQLGIGVRVEQCPHSHAASSMVSKCRNARSISSASARLQVPMRSSSDERTGSGPCPSLQSRPAADQLDGGPVERGSITVGESADSVDCAPEPL